MKRGDSKKNINKKRWLLIANVIVIGLLLILPIYLFNGRLFLGGDDTRFYISFPKLFLESLSSYSWNNISSLPYYIPNHYWIPFTFVLSIVESIIESKIIISYIGFSSVLILGFIYFQKFIKELIGEEDDISFLIALVYIASPITLVSVAFFLSPVFLISLVPIVAYYFTRFLKAGNKWDVVKATLWSIFLSFVYYSIPWIIALFLPLIFGVFIYFVFIDRKIITFLRRTLIFSFFIISSQLFWLVPFFSSLVSGGSTGLGQKAVSQSLVVSFKNTVISTANDNIVNSLLNLYHRRMVFEFDWHLKNVFLNYYDLILPIGIVFVLILFLGIIKYNQALSENKRKLFILIFTSFLAVLYLCTVNIGFLKDVFVLFAYIPGFAILRNFTDKFALSFVFFYACILALSLLVVKKSYSFYKIIFVLTLFAVLLGFAPVKQIISAPLWKTSSVYTTVNLPKEYTDFVKYAKVKIPNTTNVFALPQNITAYEIITEPNGINSYVGTSPFKFFTAINDLTGIDSYPADISLKIQTLIKERDYKGLINILSQINSGYLMVTKNTPSEILKSYLFDKEYLKFQDEKLIQAITEKKILQSNKGNYVIYKLKNNPKILVSNASISFKKISPIKYEIDIRNMKGKNKLTFFETYHPGWSLYLVCNDNMQVNDLILPFKTNIFSNSHTFINPYGNQWIMDPITIKERYGNKCFNLNIDGSVNLKLVLYFAPQKFFYLGSLLTIVLLSGGFIVLFKQNGKKRK